MALITLQLPFYSNIKEKEPALIGQWGQKVPQELRIMVTLRSG